MKPEIYDPKSSAGEFQEVPRSISVRLSRRRFIKSIIATGATVASGSMLGTLSGCSGDPSSSPTAKATEAVERLISLNINGKVRRVDVMPQETLAMTLRYKLGMTGTKLGCDRTECGACTILIDDIPTYSCATLSHSVRGRQVTTVEGLQGANGDLHPVQQAFIDELGPQCGFCTPGQLMSAVGLLKANPKPSREAARQAMAGNLCRCGAYDHYLNSVMRAAGAS
jgi:aerobic-type carbon monoxide dehydrogenase small subunit (CoxS/CutS family)